MSGKKIWTAVAAIVALAAVGGVSGTGYYVHQELADLSVDPAYDLPDADPILVPATPDPVDEQALTATLQALAADEALGTFHARISNATTGATVFDAASDQALTPASSTKILTAAAALYTLDPDTTLETQALKGTNEGDVVIKAVGDVWLNQESIQDLAEQLKAHGPVNAVFIDATAWDGQPTYLPGWDPENIDGGYVAPLEPAMLNAGRGLEHTDGDVPRSHTPALDVAQALADQLGATTVGFAPAPADGEVLAHVTSPTLLERTQTMMKNSDNVMAEAIGRETAAAVGSTNSPQATMDILTEHGFTLTGVTIADNSGLSTLNEITPALLDDILLRAAGPEDSADPELRPLLTTLPVAGGEGTLVTRYGELQGKGWVRAKTGTLTGVNALAGTVTSDKGNVYTFAFLSNGVDILPARQAMDTMASALRDF